MSTGDRRSQGFGPLETLPHLPEQIPDIDEVGIAWRDNAVFVWWDADSETYGQVHVSTTPNGEGSRARAAVTVAGRSFEIEEPLEPGTFDSDSITVDLTGRVTVRHERLELDLELKPLFTPVDWASIRALPEARPGMTLNHYQHGAVVRGTVAIDGEKSSFAGTAWRDRTWGYREESAQWREYFYLTSVFGEHYAVVLWKVLGADGGTRVFGAHISDDGHVPIETFTVIRDAAANYAGGTVELPSGTLTLNVLPKRTPFSGWWLPMGRPRQDGPTFCEYDDYFIIEASDDATGGGLAAHGILRTIV
jgi:hypothetical protein